MPIKNLTDRRRLPRLGKIHLGIKKKNNKGMEYPHEVDYFVCPPKVQEVYGEKPKELKIMFPVENPGVFFQQYYKRYSYSLLKCKGDGEKAMTWDEDLGGMKEIECPCHYLDEGKCKRIGILQFMLPDVAGAGVWQVTTSSWNSIVDINSGIDYIKALAGRIRMIPLILKRVPTTTQRIEKDGKAKSGKHYTLQIDLDNISAREIQRLGQIEPEKALMPAEIPAPDESKDDLFYPENGFKEDAEEKGFKDAEIKAQKKYREDLEKVLDKFYEVGGKTTPKQQERIKELKTPGEFAEAIDFYNRQIQSFLIEKGDDEILFGREENE